MARMPLQARFLCSTSRTAKRQPNKREEGQIKGKRRKRRGRKQKGRVTGQEKRRRANKR
jgi:hypothetical protein